MKNKGAKQKLKRKGAASAFGCDLTEHLESSGQDGKCLFIFTLVVEEQSARPVFGFVCLLILHQWDWKPNVSEGRGLSSLELFYLWEVESLLRHSQ